MPSRSKVPNSWYLKKTYTYSVDTASMRNVSVKMDAQVRPTEYKNAIQNVNDVGMLYFRVGENKIGDNAVFK